MSAAKSGWPQDPRIATPSARDLRAIGFPHPYPCGFAPARTLRLTQFVSTQPQSVQVLVAFDFSTGGSAVVDRAVELACRAPHHVLHFLAVIDPRLGVPAVPGKKIDYHYAEQVQTELTAMVHAAFAARETPAAVHFFVHARIGSPADEILSAAAELSADMIIVGSHGHTGMKRLMLGSVSERVVREAQCPVIVARPKTYKPVKLLDVVNVGEHAQHYVQPHRYSYEDSRVTRRPNDWPLY